MWNSIHLRSPIRAHLGERDTKRSCSIGSDSPANLLNTFPVPDLPSVTEIFDDILLGITKNVG